MKYYEFNDPYYALIQAENQEQAIDQYTDVVSDTDDDTLDTLKEISKESQKNLHG